MKYYASRYQSLLVAALFFIIAALLYLPSAPRIGYYADDWASMYAARTAGPRILNQYYIVDARPARALVTIPLYMLFKGNPYYYSLSAYLFRVLGALTMLWVLRLVWPVQRRETFWTALLFLVYPGFLSQTIPVDFQSHLIAIWMAYLSIGLGLKSIFVQDRFQRRLLWIGAVLSGWFYLGLMEYYIGFEAVRLLLTGVIFLRYAGGWMRNILSGLRSWLAYAFIPFTFLIWRLFIFEGQRKVTDVGTQFGVFAAMPFKTILSWLVYFLQDIMNVTVLAWGVPLSQLGFNLRLRDGLTAFGLSLLVLILFYLALSLIDGSDADRPQGADFATEAFWVGGLWVPCGLVAVTLANRHIVFPEYARYGFVSAGGAVLLLAALLSRIKGRRIQLAALGFLLVSATITHHANGVRFADLADDIRAFWWQASWRIPALKPGTTLVAHYPNGGIIETSTVWGPANQIYFPEGTATGSVQPGISAILLNPDTVRDILNQKNQYADIYNFMEFQPDPRHILILTRPGPYSCLQVIDGAAPEYSGSEDPMFLMIGSHSEPGYIKTESPFQAVPEFLFGPEPKHDWCYFYEKAALARQRRDWSEVLKLGIEADRQKHRPDDLIEWMPFLEAYARSGDEKALARLASVIQSDKFVARQACDILGGLQGLNAGVRSVIDMRYCHP